MNGLLAGMLVTMLAASTGTSLAAESNAVPVWADTAPLTKQNVVLALDGGAAVRVDVLGPRLFRIRHSKDGQWTESGLNRYGILAATFPAVTFRRDDAGNATTLTTREARLTVSRKDGAVTLSAADTALTRQAAPTYTEHGGYDIRFSLAKDERIYGLGDSNRDNVMRRGGVYDIRVLNVTSYIPIPMVLSSRGWGLLMNTTWRNRFDVGTAEQLGLLVSALAQQGRTDSRLPRL